MGRMSRKMLPITTDWKELSQPMDIKPLFGLCGVLIAAMTSEFNDQVTSVALSDVRGALGTQPRCWTLARKPICVGRDHRHGDFALAVDDLHVKALDAFCDRAVRRLERARTSRRSMLIGMGSRRRSASLTIDLLGGEGVNLGCLFTLCRSPSWLIR